MNFIDNVRRGAACRRLEMELGKKFDLGRSFKANGVAPGDERFGRLARESAELITQYSEKFDVPQAEIEQKFPSLVTLNELAATEAEPGKRSVIGMVIAGVIALFAAAAGTGLIAGVFHWSYHLVAQ